MAAPMFIVGQSSIATCHATTVLPYFSAVLHEYDTDEEFEAISELTKAIEQAEECILIPSEVKLETVNLGHEETP